MSERSFRLDTGSVIDDLQRQRQRETDFDDPVAHALDDADRAMRVLIERIERSAASNTKTAKVSER